MCIITSSGTSSDTPEQQLNRYQRWICVTVWHHNQKDKLSGFSLLHISSGRVNRGTMTILSIPHVTIAPHTYHEHASKLLSKCD